MVSETTPTITDVLEEICEYDLPDAVGNSMRNYAAELYTALWAETDSYEIAYRHTMTAVRYMHAIAIRQSLHDMEYLRDQLAKHTVINDERH